MISMLFSQLGDEYRNYEFAVFTHSGGSGYRELICYGDDGIILRGEADIICCYPLRSIIHIFARKKK